MAQEAALLLGEGLCEGDSNAVVYVTMLNSLKYCIRTPEQERNLLMLEDFIIVTVHPK